MTIDKYEESDFVRGNMSSYAFMRKMDIGEEIDLAENTSALYRAAKEAGIKISIRELKNGDIRVKRIA